MDASYELIMKPPEKLVSALKVTGWSWCYLSCCSWP